VRFPPHDPVSWRCEPKTLPPRDYMLGRHLQRSTVNMIAGSDHTVTKAIMLTELVGLAAGRNLLTGEKITSRRVWFLDAHHDQDELDRRVAAVFKRFKISASNLNGRLFVQSVAGRLLHLARTNRHGDPEVVETAMQWLEMGITQNAIDVLAFTPLDAFHHVNCREEPDMTTLAREALGSIAVRARCAIEVGNHLTKNLEISGSAALLNAMSETRTVVPMTEGEADRCGVAEPERYVRVAGTGDDVVWIELDKVGLNGDLITVAALWRPQGDVTELRSSGPHKAKIA
jgi:hypothetical protein